MQGGMKKWELPAQRRALASVTNLSRVIVSCSSEQINISLGGRSLYFWIYALCRFRLYFIFFLFVSLIVCQADGEG